MRNSSRVTAAIAVLCLAPGSARAGKAAADACAADAKRLCPPAAAREGRYSDCLRGHLSQISMECAQSHPELGAALPPTPPPPSVAPASRQEHRAAPPEVGQAPLEDWKTLSALWKGACGESLQRLCPGASNERRLWSCVEKRWNSLAQPCRDFARDHEPWLRHCPSETARFCAAAAPRDTSRCMKPHLKELSGACKAFAVPGAKTSAPPVAEAGKDQSSTGLKIGDCASDAEKLCTPEENKPGKRAECLRRHFSALSKGCADGHPEWKEDALKAAPKPAKKRSPAKR